MKQEVGKAAYFPPAKAVNLLGQLVERRQKVRPDRIFAMEEKALRQRLWEIAARFGVPRGTIKETFSPPFDTSKPNHHDTKAAFLREKHVVEEAVRSAEKLIETILLTQDTDEQEANLGRRLWKHMNKVSKEAARGETQRPKYADEFIRKCVRENNFTLILLQVLFDALAGLEKRKQELADQEVAFWSRPGRPPDHTQGRLPCASQGF